MSIKQRYVIGSIFLVLTVSLQAQNIPSTLRSSIKDGVKNDLMKQIKPETTSTYGSQKYDNSLSAPKVFRNDDYTNLEKIHKNGKSIDLKVFDDKYQVNPMAITNTSSTPINQLPAGYVVPVFTGGKWIWANPNTRIDQLAIPSRIDLSGGGKKKMSAKAKAILEQVFGMKVEE